jgi:hypothetical protein
MSIPTRMHCWVLPAALSMGSVFFLACSSSATGALAPQALLTSLSEGQATQLCDWLASQFGGYGHSIGCDGGSGGGATGLGPMSQATCTQQLTQSAMQFPR